MSAQYNDFTGKWHSEYIAKTKGMSLDELLYTIRDCKAAMDAYPENPKCGQYADERSYCAMEMNRRRNKVSG